MCRLIESIKLLDGEFYNLAYHQQRMLRAAKHLWKTGHPIDLKTFLDAIEKPSQGLYKCRITYDEKDSDFEFVPYTPKLIRTLQLVEHNQIAYDHKYEDRRALDELFAQRGACDDILIIKNDEVTDSYYANIVFGRGNQWFTPRSALLEGTMRQSLMDRGIIKSEVIRRQDIASFERFKLVNAMVGFNGPELDIRGIKV